MKRRKFIKHGALLVPALFLPNILIADKKAVLSSRNIPAGGYTYIYEQDFESGTTPSGWSGTADFGYATSPAPLVGSFSLKITDGNAAEYATIAGTPTEIWTFCLCNISDSGSAIFSLRKSNGDLLCRCLLSAGNLLVFDGSVSATATTAFPLTTTVRLWMHYKAGSGADGTIELWWSLDDTLPSDNGHHAISTSSVQTTGAFRLDCEGFGGGGGNNIYDKIRLSTSAIGSNPN